MQSVSELSIKATFQLKPPLLKCHSNKVTLGFAGKDKREKEVKRLRAADGSLCSSSSLPKMKMICFTASLFEICTPSILEGTVSVIFASKPLWQGGFSGVET